MEKTERKILDMVDQGQITADEGLRLMNAMNKNESAQSKQADANEVFEPEFPAAGPTSAIPAEDLTRMKQLKRWWLLPFGIGLVILLLGATWMYMGYSNAGFGFGFWLAWLPFLLGIVIIAVSFNSRKGVWLHLNVKQAPGESPQNIRISLPMPLNLAKWFFSTFGDKVTGLKDQPIGDIPSILDNLSPEEPFYLHVNDDEDGEEVEIFIG
jgi:hypothetical protein